MNRKSLLWLLWCTAALSYFCCFQAVSLASASSSKASDSSKASEGDFVFEIDDEDEGDGAFVEGENGFHEAAPTRARRTHCSLKKVSDLASIQNRREARLTIQLQLKACLDGERRESHRQTIRQRQDARDAAIDQALASALEGLNFRRQDPHRLSSDEQDES